MSTDGIIVITEADLAMLDSLARVTIEDHFDYDGLFDYDDDDDAGSST